MPRILLFLLFFAPTTVTADDLIVHPVGDLGDVRRLEFRGLQQIPIDQIRDALSENFDFQFAAHPAGPRHQLLSSLKDLIGQGYRKSGFAEPSVKAAYDATNDRIVVTVDEGKRIRAGEVRFVGEPQVDVTNLAQALTAPEKGRRLRAIIDDGRKDMEGQSTQTNQKSEEEDEEPIWKPGKPVSFLPDAAERRVQRIQDALMDLGYADGKVTAELELQPGAELADLVVSLENPGRRMVIEEIDVQGLDKNDHATFVDYISVREGDTLTRELSDRIHHRLYDSARFWRYRVVPQALDDTLVRFRLAIEVVEYPPAPPLGTDFLPEHQLLLKMGKHIENLADSDDDLVIHAEGGLHDGEFGSLESATLILSPKRGALLSANGVWGTQRPARYAVVLCPDELGLYSAGRGEKYRVEVITNPVHIGGSLTPTGDGSDGEFGGEFRFNAWSKSDDDEPEAGPVRFHFRLTPVVLLRDAVRDGTQVTTQNGVTQFEREGVRILLDSETGRLIECVMANPQNDSQARVTLARGEFERQYKGWQDELAPALNYRHPEAPLGSLAAFLSDEWIWVLGNSPPNVSNAQVRLNLLTRLLDKAFLASVRKSLGKEKNTDAEEDDKFTIPSNWQPSGAAGNKVQWFFLIGSRLAPGSAEALFPRRSWPWTVLREAGFYIHGKGTYTYAEVGNLLVSEDMGPLGCLAIAQLLKLANSDGAKLFAIKGKVGRLTVAEFRKDSRLLTQGDTLLAKLTRQVAEILRDAEPAEVEAVAELLPTEIATWLKKSATSVRLGADRAAEEIFRDSLDELWLTFLQDWTRGQLDKLSRGE